VRRAAAIGLILAAAASRPVAADTAAARPAWRSLPEAAPAGERRHTGSFTVADPPSAGWRKPAIPVDEKAARGRKRAPVAVVIYDPVLASEGGKTLTEHLKANDPVEYSHILANVIREASWGYINYEITDFIRIDGFPEKVDGFRYTDRSFLEARKSEKWQPSPASYRKVLEEAKLLDRLSAGDVREVWVWGSGGMHFDEFAGYIPNRYARFAPTDNPWFYRPYDIPPEIGRTTWVMGFNYEVGPDNMVHSYTHRVESMAALALAGGVWDTHARRDPWNVFSWLEMDHPGSPSQVGNCHVPPNGQGGYDYDNKRRVLSWADAWSRYPDLRGKPRLVSSAEWGSSQFGFQKWILEHVPKGPGATEFGLNNWWVYIANTDEDLPELEPPDPARFVLPEGLPPPGPKPAQAR
jgi:hypothetical protein